LQSADWKALRDFVAKDNWGEMEFLRLALAARAWSQLGMQQISDSQWNSAVTEAMNRLGPLTTLLGLTEDWKLPREQRDLLERVADKFPRERWAQEALERLYLNTGETAGLNRLYAKLAAVFPNDAGYKNNLAFTSLLLNTNVAQAGRWAAEAYAARTNDPAMASTYSLALYLQGHTPEGLAVLRQLDPRQLQQPDVALYYGVLLTASGATNDAAPFLKIARAKSGWLPEEKRLLDHSGGL
jgi:cellulose synthase operon protein C